MIPYGRQDVTQEGAYRMWQPVINVARTKRKPATPRAHYRRTFLL